MTDFQPGDRVRVVLDATIVQLASGGLGFEVDQPGTSWHRWINEVEGADIRPADSTRTEFAVAYGLSTDPGAGPEDAAGRHYYDEDDEAGAFEDAQWLKESGVFRRRVDVGPWEVAPDD